MSEKPTYEEMKQRIQELEKTEFELKSSQKALQESEDRYRSVVEDMPVLICSFLPSGEITFVNRTYCEYFDKTSETLIGSNFLSLIPEVDQQAVMDNIHALTVESPTQSHEHTVIAPTGDVRWQRWTNRALFNAQGKAVGYQSIGEDITEYKQVEEVLRENEEKYRTLVEGLPGLIYSYSTIRGGIYYGPNVQSVLGHSESHLLQNPQLWHDSIHPEDIHRVDAVIKDFQYGKPFEIEYRIKDTKGNWLWFLDRSIGRKKENGEVVIEGIATDITKLKRSVQALQESEEIMRSVLETSPVGISIYDETGQCFVANDSIAQMIGATKSQVLQQNYNNIESWKLSGILNKAKRAIKENVSKRHDIIGGSTFGQSVRLDCYLVPFSSGRLLLMAHDITERIQAEKTLRESEVKLARSKKMESLGLLAGGVAHDLNNVLSGIVSYPELILMDLPKDSKLRKPIETMQESGHMAAAIVQDLLTMARGVATTKEPLNLNDIVSDYLNSPEFKKLEHFHPTVTVKTNLDTDLLNIGGSHVHIRKLVMNLVSNASEAIEGSGNVTISTLNRYVDRPLRGYDDVNIGEYAILSVSDNGSGISSDDFERIFEPFYTKKVMGRSGTGLGLAVVWNTVQDHKGYIDVTSDENGTTFELYFPITRDEISGKDLSIPIKDYKGNGETILVVDDVKSQREISCKMLDTLGYKTKSVCSGEEAVEYLKENTVDLLLLDMIMDPGINGRETYARIIEIHPNQKAIIASGYAETDEVKEVQKMGAGRYIKKPVTLEKIGLAVIEELEK